MVLGICTDTDDDNDSILDTDEKARGSNPLVPNPTTQEAPKAEEAVTEVIQMSNLSNRQWRRGS
jgi:hypothetical protein